MKKIKKRILLITLISLLILSSVMGITFNDKKTALAWLKHQFQSRDNAKKYLIDAKITYITDKECFIDPNTCHVDTKTEKFDCEIDICIIEVEYSFLFNNETISNRILVEVDEHSTSEQDDELVRQQVIRDGEKQIKRKYPINNVGYIKDKKRGSSINARKWK